MAYKGKPTSTGGEGNIANLLVTLYNDRELSTKEGDDAEFPESAEDGSDVSEKIDHLDATIASLTEQLDSFYQEREMVQSALGFSDSKQIVELVRNLEAQVASLQANRPEQDTPDYDSAPQTNVPASREGLSRLHQVVDKVRMLTAQRDDMQAQLTVLYADSEKLTQVNAERAEMEAQLDVLNADREKLIQELGTADPAHISDTVHSLSAQLASLYEDRELFQSEFQTADPAIVIAEHKKILNLIRVLEEDLDITDI